VQRSRRFGNSRAFATELWLYGGSLRRTVERSFSRSHDGSFSRSLNRSPGWTFARAFDGSSSRAIDRSFARSGPGTLGRPFARTSLDLSSDVVGPLESAAFGGEIAVEIVSLSQIAPIGVRQADDVLVKAFVAKRIAERQGDHPIARNLPPTADEPLIIAPRARWTKTRIANKPVVASPIIVAPTWVRPPKHARAIGENRIVEIRAYADIEPRINAESRVLRSVIVSEEIALKSGRDEQIVNQVVQRDQILRRVDEGLAQINRSGE
jgi:hypothetical protein